MPLFIKLTKTREILRILKLIAWIAFFAFAIFTGSILISYIVSINSPEGAANLYEGFNLVELYQYNFWLYSLMILIILLFSILKATVWYMIANIISKIELNNPFTKKITRRLEIISYTLFTIFILGIVVKIYVAILKNSVNPVMVQIHYGEFLFTAGLVFIISQIFKRGVELQSENELTV